METIREHRFEIGDTIVVAMRNGSDITVTVTRLSYAGIEPTYYYFDPNMGRMGRELYVEDRMCSATS